MSNLGFSFFTGLTNWLDCVFWPIFFIEVKYEYFSPVFQAGVCFFSDWSFYFDDQVRETWEFRNFFSFWAEASFFLGYDPFPI